MKMTFDDLVKDIDFLKKKGDFNTVIKGLQYDSRKDCAGKAFFCLKGEVADGHKYIEKAVKNGSPAAVVQDWTGSNADIPVLQVENSRKAMALAASKFYGYPSTQMDLVGVTGTNGKTTVSFLVNKIFRKAGQKGGLIGTVKCSAGKEEIPIDRTTPESADLQEILNHMLCKGVKNCVMEVSSHAVAMDRVTGTHFKAMAFTNLSQDHLDFHKNMEDYFNSKKKLFNKTGQIDVVNIDDNYGKELAQSCKNVMTFGINSNADVMARSVKMNNRGTGFVLTTPKGEVKVKTMLGGLFNVYNCLAAAALTEAIGIDLKTIKAGLQSLESVPGRLQFVKRKPFNIIVDYAHTPDGIENLLKAVRSFTGGKVITVFGCGGDRDRGKRPKMGKASIIGSDFSIVTTDNPRSEEPSDIIKEIVEGLDNQSYWIEEDRKKAIEKAIKLAKKGDSVVIAGKGHETYQEIKGNKYPFDDVAVVREIIGNDV